MYLLEYHRRWLRIIGLSTWLGASLRTIWDVWNRPPRFSIFRFAFWLGSFFRFWNRLLVHFCWCGANMEAASRIGRCANGDCAADGLSGALLFHRYRIGSCRVAGRVASAMALRAHLDNCADCFAGNDFV